VADELGAAHRADLDEVSAGEDVVVWSIVARFRAALRSGAHLDDVERDSLVRLLYQRVLEKAFGASPPRRSGGPLDAVRLARVTDFIEAHLGEELSIERLSDVAALSPFHFLRSFRAAAGVPPHRFVKMRRMERAKEMLLSGSPLRSAASATGYKSRSWFAAAFKQHFGHGPGEIPRRKGALWG
jgi:AraC family transcriptional regulator